MKALLQIFVCIISVFGEISNTITVKSASISRDIVVHSYDIVIEPYFPFGDYMPTKELNKTFDGSVSIVFSVLKQTNVIELYSGVSIFKTYITGTNGKRYTINKQNGTPKKTLIIETNENLNPNNQLTLYFKYTGKINIEDDKGLIGTWDNVGIKKRIVVATNLQPTFASLVFPCFDHPSFKSVFKLSLIHPKGSKAYSNMPIKKQSPNGKDKILTEFEVTPKISTTNVAFAIGDFVEKSVKSKSKVEVRIITPPYLKDGVQFSLDAAVNCLNSIEELTGIKYPLSKLNHLQLAVINKRIASSSYHLDLNIYKNVIFQPLYAPRNHYFNVAKEICQQTVRQYFGGIVNAKEIGQEFLQEAFANVFQNLVLAKFPDQEYGTMVDYIEVWQRYKNLETWGYVPLVSKQRPVHNYLPFNIGGAVLQQIRHVLGDKAFYKGVNIYLTKNMYKAVDYNNLIDSFSEAIGNEKLCGKLSFRDFAETWFKKISFPKINISKIDSNGNDDKYFFDVYVYGDSTKNQKTDWHIPLFIYDLNNKKEHLAWLINGTSFCSKENFRLSPGPYIFNNNGKSATIMRYNINLWNELFSENYFDKFSDRSKFVMLTEDRGNNANATEGIGAINRSIKNVKNYKDGFMPFQTGLALMNVDDTDMYLRILNGFDLKDDSFINRVMGALTLKNLVVKYGRQDENFFLINNLKKEFETFKADCTNGDVRNCCKTIPEFREAVYLMGFIVSSTDNFNFLQMYYETLMALEDPLYLYEANKVTNVITLRYLRNESAITH